MSENNEWNLRAAGLAVLADATRASASVPLVWQVDPTQSGVLATPPNFIPPEPAQDLQRAMRDRAARMAASAPSNLAISTPVSPEDPSGQYAPNGDGSPGGDVQRALMRREIQTAVAGAVRAAMSKISTGKKSKGKKGKKK